MIAVHRMKWLSVVLVMVVSMGSAAAQSADQEDASVLHMRRVLEKHARKDHKFRTILGGVSLGVGAAAAGVGVYAYTKTDPNDFLSPIGYVFDYAMIGTGALGLASGTILLLMRTPHEHIYASFEQDAAIDPHSAVARAHLAIDEYDARLRHRQHVMAVVGAGVLAAGVASFVTFHYIPSTIEDTSGQLLFVGGAFATIIGADLLIIPLSARSPFDDVRKELAVTPVVAPTHGGGVVGFAGAF